MADLSDAASQFRDLARNLTLVGDDELRRELYSAVSGAARPLLDDIRRGMPDYMPDRYAATLGADLSLGSAKGAEAGVRVWARPRVRARKLRRLDAGRITHPVFGNRGRWVTQTAGMRPGWFTAPAQASAPQVRDAILAAMHRISEKALGRG